MESRKRPRILFLTGTDIHDFDASAPLIERALAERFDVIQTRELEDLRELSNGNYQAVIIHTQGPKGQLTDELAHSLKRFVQSGGGMVGVHCAAGSFVDNATYLQLIGSQFQTHSPIMDFTVRFTDKSHFIAARCDDFSITDELYVLQKHADFQTIAVAHYHGQDRPMAYQRAMGKGTVIYLANGHDTRALGNRYFQRMLERSVRYACGERAETQIKAGILGYGGQYKMGRVHAHAISAQPGMDVTAVCDSDPKRTEVAKQELGQITTYNNMDRFLADGAFDLVVEILPHHLHAKTCIAASKAGKHVISEKPFCITLDEADQMIAAAEKAGKLVTCFHNRRWDDDFRAALQLVRDGVIGEVFRIDAGSATYGEPGTEWRSSKEISGGAIYDWGAHYCDWLLNLANKRIKSVTGDFQKRKWFAHTNEDYTYVLIRFEGDTTASLEQGSIAAISRAGWRILGTDGGIQSQGSENDLKLVTFANGKRIESQVQKLPSRWDSFHANIGNHLILGERLVVTPQQARRVIGVLYLAEQSARQGGRPLPLPGEEFYEPDYMIGW